MKTFLLSIVGLLFLTTGKVNAQYYLLQSNGSNPKDLNMDAEWPENGGLPAGWTTVRNLNDPAAFSTPSWSINQSMPFSFIFNSVAFSSYKISTSGVLTFDVGTSLPAPSYTNASLPSANIPDNSICVWGLEPVTRSFAASNLTNRIISKTFGTAPNRQHWVQFNFYGHKSIQKGWTFWSIVLEESTNKIYIVDQKTVCATQAQQACSGKTAISAGIQYNSSSALEIPGSPALQNKAGGDASPGDNQVYEFTFGTQPNLDFSVLRMNNDGFGVNKPIKLYGAVRNTGKTTVTNFKLNYQAGTDPAVSMNITGVSIASGETYLYEHSTPVSFTSSGNRNIKVWASELNGQEDDDHINDTLIKNVPVADILRVSLHEIFSSSTCGPCAPGNANYKTIVAGRDKNLFSSIKYQQDFPGTGDPYSTEESVARRAYYGINSIPRMEIDGQWDGNAQTFSNALFAQYQTQEASVRIEATYKVVGKAVDVTVKLKSDAGITGSTNKLYIALIEGKTANNIKSNGETEFFHVMKKMLPNANGFTLAEGLPANEEKELNFSYTFPGEYKLAPNGKSPINLETEHSVENWDDIEVIVFIQGSNKKVLQSAVAERTEFYKVGLNKVNAELQTGVYPNPATDYFTISSATSGRTGILKVFDITGKEVVKPLWVEFNKTQIGCSNLSKGIYFIEIEIEGKTATQKLIITR